MNIDDSLQLVDSSRALAEALLQTTSEIKVTDIGVELQIRRGISGLYYSAFYCITQVGSALLMQHDPTRKFASRAFRHKQIAGFFQQQFTPSRLKDPRNKYLIHFNKASLPHISTLAEQFVNLQTARHDADYDLDIQISTLEARQVLEWADEFFESYQSLLTSHLDDLKTLTAILLFKDISVVL